MTSVQSAPLYLLEVARALGRQKRDRVAALAYASVARAPGVSPRLQAFALYRAAAHISAAASATTSTEQSEEDRTRAVQFLQRCTFLLKNQPDSFGARMQVFALLENVHTAGGDYYSAAKVIKTALEDIAANIDVEGVVMHWWVYFRGRVMSNAVMNGGPVQAALKLASESAAQCARQGDAMCATAFYLAKCQIALGSLRPDTYDCTEALREAQSCLRQVVPSTRLQEADFILLNFSALLMEALSLIRLGDMTDARTNVSPKLQRASEKLQALQEDGVVRGSWRWLPRNFSSALTLHVIAIVNHRSVDGRQALPHATAALAQLGIDVAQGARLSPDSLRFPRVSGRASVALAVALLESAARMHLVKVNLNSAAPLISAALAISFSDPSSRQKLHDTENREPTDLTEIVTDDAPLTSLVTQCATLLLSAEYHCLVGRISGAQTAVEYLKPILAVPERYGIQSSRVSMYDTLQAAASYLSLLTGDVRNANLGRDARGGSSSQAMVRDDGTLEGAFVSKHVLGMAWFTVGVYYMRKTDVIESRKAFANALNILGNVSCVNEQVVANAMTVMCGLDLTHETITDDAQRMINSAVSLARAMDDPVTVMRAARQNVKWVKRIRLGTQEQEKAQTLHVNAACDLGARQEASDGKLEIIPPNERPIEVVDLID